MAGVFLAWRAAFYSLQELSHLSVFIVLASFLLRKDLPLWVLLMMVLFIFSKNNGLDSLFICFFSSEPISETDLYLWFWFFFTAGMRFLCWLSFKLRELSFSFKPLNYNWLYFPVLFTLELACGRLLNINGFDSLNFTPLEISKLVSL